MHDCICIQTITMPVDNNLEPEVCFLRYIISCRSFKSSHLMKTN